MDARTILRGFGKSCISVGVLILLFVAYQLWGTGIAEARSQHHLLHQFDAARAARGAPVRPTTTTTPSRGSTSTTSRTSTSTTSPPTTVAALPPPPTGGALAVISIPKIHLNAAVVEGVGTEDLKKGPGHYPGTPAPGQPGNTAIAGHRTTYGHPFYDLDALGNGDEIDVSTLTGTFRYTVFNSMAVSPSDVSVVQPTSDNRLTLTTCTPRYSARQRLVVQAHLDGPAIVAPTPTTLPPAAPVGSPPSPVTIPADAGGLSGHGTSTLPAIAWGLACAAVWLASWLIGRRWRRWTAYALGTPVFLVLLYFFFENFARFLPANI